MGRHGGGSRSGGSRSRHRGGSRSRGSSISTSTQPFYGCYNRTYFDRDGIKHTYYTSDASFGTKKGFSFGNIAALIFVTFHMLVMIGALSLTFFSFGEKVNGDTSRIFIEDNSNLLNEEQEEKILNLFHKVYQESGMPITLYTTNFDWRNHYGSIEVYSEELYYKIGMNEDAMIILFTSDDVNGFWDWEYDIYCGDATIKCLSNEEFDTLLNNFQKSMAKQDLAYALDYSWNSVVDNIGETEVDFSLLPAIAFLLFFYGIFYAAIFKNVRNKNEVYNYFKENPEKLSMTPMTIYNECPSCGAQNISQSEYCECCGLFLKIVNPS